MKVKYSLSIGYAGCNEEEIVEFPNDTSDAVIETYGIELVQE